MKNFIANILDQSSILAMLRGYNNLVRTGINALKPKVTFSERTGRIVLTVFYTKCKTDGPGTAKFVQMCYGDVRTDEQVRDFEQAYNDWVENNSDLIVCQPELLEFHQTFSPRNRPEVTLEQHFRLIMVFVSRIKPKKQTLPAPPKVKVLPKPSERGLPALPAPPEQPVTTVLELAKVVLTKGVRDENHRDVVSAECGGDDRSGGRQGVGS